MFRAGRFVLLLSLLNGVLLSESESEESAGTGNRYVEDGVPYEIVQVNAGRKVNHFGSYRDVILTEYVVPPETQGAVFGYSSTSSRKGCSPDKTIVVKIQHGAFPLVQTGNESRWADNVYSHRSDVATLEYPANETTWKISIPAPRSGRWYSAVYVKEPVEEIKQTGLHTKCDITYFSSLLVAAYTNPVFHLEDGHRYFFVSTAAAVSNRTFKMCLAEERVDYVDVIMNCTKGCPAVIVARSDGLPTASKNLPLTGVSSVFCTTPNCALSYFPIQKKCQYIHLGFVDLDIETSFFLSISSVKCRKPPAPPAPLSLDLPLLENDNTTMNESYYHVPAAQQPNPALQPTCPYLLHLARLDSGPAFATVFGVNHYTWPSPEFLYIPRDVYSDTILTFEIQPYKDTGGTLVVALNMSDVATIDLQNLTVVACLTPGISSRFQIENSCLGPVLKINETQRADEVLIPYPEIGVWHLNIQGQPLITPTVREANYSLVYIPVHFVVKTTQCSKGGCGVHGSCRVSLNTGVMITSSCSCQAGWKGWDCSDGDSADSMRDLFIAIFFLTISNLFFIPATVVAVKRKYYAEALVYFCTCFFSSFYHACDQPLKRLALCIMDFGVLQFCDFYVSILSFWVTIIAMADLPPNLKAVAHTAGCIGIALGVEYEKTGLWVFAVPALTALTILATSWGLRSYRLKQIVPRKTYWLVHFLPGFLFAALGLILFAFVETRHNYKFVHSVWHVAMALAVVCFLPPQSHRHDGKYPKIRAIGGTDSTFSTSTTVSQELARNSESDIIIG